MCGLEKRETFGFRLMGYLSSEWYEQVREHDFIRQPSTTAIVYGNHYLLFQPKGGWRERRPDKGYRFVMVQFKYTEK